MILTFQGYSVGDSGITLYFTSDNGRVKLFLADSELTAVTTQVQLRALVTAKLRRKLQAEGIASKLDAFVGMSVTI
jgi:hypothetical protein